MEKDSKFQMSTWKVDWADLHANSKIIGPAILSLVYGTSFKFIINLS